MLRGLLSVLILWLGLTAPERADAETRALLIGVSDYDDASGIPDLRGPANDVRLLAEALRGRGIDRIALLADGVEGAERPTRAAILDRFARLAAEARAGDFIYIHLSGHGTRQPDRNGDETDGLDEVFLPADTARAEPGAGAIPNAITDDEIGEALAAIRARGANVWLVLDSCHSGSGTRAALPGTATRFVDPAVLGVAAAPSVMDEAAGDPAGAADLPGGFLAFYSAQSTELAREVNFAEAEGGEAWYGLFTAKLAARLQQEAAISFRQLFQAVLSDMAGAEVPGVARLQTPLWEGDLIDSAVFGGRATAGLRRFAITGDSLAAGRLHGVTEGTLLELVADAADPPEAVIGHAQVDEADAAEAFLRPVAAECQPRAGALCPRAGSLPTAARFAQIAAQPADLTVAFAPPRALQTGAALAEDHPMVRALAEAARQAAEDTGLGLTVSAADFDIDVAHDAGTLWFGITAESGNTPVGAAWAPGEADLAALLTRIARAERLARVLRELAGAGSLLNRSPVAVEALLVAPPIEALADPGSGVSPRRECRAAWRAASGLVPLRLEPGAPLKQCDGLRFSAQGTTGGTWDVNRIHIDAQFCVHAAYERITGNRAARDLGPAMTICSDCPGGYSAGAERLFVLVSEARDNAEALNLEGLVETCGAGPTRSAAASGAARAFLDDLVAQGRTRGAFGSALGGGLWVDAWSWQVLPRREAFRRAGRPVTQTQHQETQQDY